MRKRGDDSLLTRSRFMHTNTHDQQSNGLDENPKRSMDHAEELETLKATITENEDLIRQLEIQLQKLEESIKKVNEENRLNKFDFILDFQYEKFSEETKTEIETLNKDMSVKKQAAAYLLSIDPETERLQVE